MSANFSTRNHPIISSYIVLMTNIEDKAVVDGVDCVDIKSINYEYMKEYMKLRCSHVWGLKLDKGVLYPVEVTLPIEQNLDGWATIHKSHKMFDGVSANHYEFGREKLIAALAQTFTAPINQKGLVAVL